MNETVKNIIERKSATSFKNKHIKKEQLDLIINAGLNAPSGMNNQPVILIAISDDETVKKLDALNAQIAKKSLMKISPEVANKFGDTAFHGAKDVIAVVAKKNSPTYIYDGSLAIGNMLNAAYSMGIGSRWIHRCKEVFESDLGKNILNNLGVTDEVEGIGFCVLGYTNLDKPKAQIKENRKYYIKNDN